MPDILTLIKTRRSIRNFLDTPPADPAVKKIIEAGRWAPSGLNNQPWRFLVIDDAATKDKLADLTRYGSIIRKAACLIVVFMDAADSYNRKKDLMATGACIQNMLLEAHSLKLGACWLGEILNRKNDVARLLGSDENTELMAVVALGYPRPADRIKKGCRRPAKDLMLRNPVGPPKTKALSRR